MNRVDKDVLLALKQDGARYHYFFTHATSKKLLPDLKELGFFDAPPAAEKKDGYVSFKRWAPAEYLIAVASEDPKAVMDIILAVKDTDNSAVHVQFVQASLKMPVAEAKRIASKAGAWVDKTPIANLPNEVADLVQHLAAGGETVTALKLARHMLAVTDPNDGKDTFMRIAMPKVGTFELDEFLANQFGGLFALDPVRAAGALADSLNAALTLEKRNADQGDYIEDYSEIWHANLANTAHRSDAKGILSGRLFLLVSGVTNHETLKLVIDELLKKKYKIFRRIVAGAIGPDNPDAALAKLYREFTERWGEPNHEDTTTSWTGPESPLTDKEFDELSTQDLVKYLNEWQPTRDFMAPSKEGLGYLLNRKIVDDPTLGIALLSAGVKIEPEYLQDLYSGLGTVVRNKRPIDWQPTVASLVLLAKQLEKDMDPKDYELVLSICRLLEDGVNVDQLDLSAKSNRDIILRYISLGLQANDPDASNPEDPFDKSRDPDVGGINSVRGVALFTLIAAMKRATRQKADKSLGLFEPNELKRILSLLDRHVSLMHEKSFAVRTAFAHELPFLQFAVPDWSKAHLSDIFPYGQDDYFRVNVESFVEYTPVYLGVLPTVKPVLLEYIKRVKAKQYKDVSKQTIEHFAVKVVSYYLGGEIEFEDDLMQNLLGLGPEWGASLVGAIGRALVNFDDRALGRAREYWDKRREKAYKQEKALIGLWFVSDKLDFEWREKALADALQNVSDMELVWTIHDWLITNAEKYPQQVANMLDEILRTQTGKEMSYTINRQLDEVLPKLLATGDEAVISKVESIVDRMLKRQLGDYRYVLKQ